MLIEGLQKLTLLDYPDKIACTVFTHGCNFRCPFCHNASLVVGKSAGSIDMDEIKAFFEKRKGILDGVCITGGEPLLQKGVGEFASLAKSYGYLVKLDTNGSFPEKLKEFVEKRLVDYVAMDIKSSQSGYGALIGMENFDLSSVKESVDFLKQGNIPYEFRTTVVKPLHTLEDFTEIGKWLRGAEKYFLQQFVDSGDVISDGLSAYSKEEMESFRQAVLPYVPNTQLRGL